MIPGALTGCFVFPEHLTIPPELQYDYMAYQLAKNFKISVYDAMQTKEIDYYKLSALANLESARENFAREFLNNKNYEQ